jgi:hypothetical protein
MFISHTEGGADFFFINKVQMEGNTEVVCTVRLLFDYLLDFLIAIHSRVFVLDLAGDIDFEKPKS